MAKRALVTGGAGFIGSHVSDLFIERGWAVDVMDDFSSGKRENLPKSAKVHELDVRSAEARRLVTAGSYDAIVHLAAQIDVRKSVADPVNDASINIIGSLNLLEGLRGSASPKTCRFIFISTGGALYGDFVTPPNVETFAKNPEAPYGIAKLSVEFYLAYYARLHGMDTLALRLGNVYGPRQDPHGEAGVVAIFCGRVFDNRPLTVFGDGSQTRDYVYVKDVAEAVWLGATKPLPKPDMLDARSFNIGTGVGSSVNELAKTLLRVSGSKVPVEHAPARPGEQQHSFLDVAKAAEVLGWRPSRTFAEGLAESFNWFKAKLAAKTPA